jgi:hypothetical protein
MTEDIWVKGYVYCVSVVPQDEGRFRGQILVKSHRYSGRNFEPPVLIETPALFKREHAAEIEARALARELIDGGAIEAHLQPPPAATQAGSRSSHTE